MIPLMQAYEDIVVCLCLYREARGCSHEEKVAITHVIFNRARAGKLRLSDVVLKPYQFSSFLQNDPNVIVWPKNEINNRAWNDCLEAFEAVSTGMVADPTNGATHYHSFSNPAQFPKWADANKQTLRTQSFHFYKLP